MANNTYAFGLAPHGSVGNKGFGGIRTYYMPSTDSDPAYIGDLVVTTTTANSAAVNGHKAGSLETVTIVDAASSTAVTGVIVGFEPTGRGKATGAASTERVVYVMDDPNATFRVRANSDSITAAVIGKNVDIDYAAGSSFTGLSGVTVDGSTAATTATLPLKVIGIVQQEGENEVGAGAMLEVMLNTSTLSHNKAGI